jgi:hypothetical protein
MNPDEQRETLQADETLRRGKLLSPYWDKYRALITQMFAPAFSRLPANCVLFEIGVHGAAYRRIEVAETFK